MTEKEKWIAEELPEPNAKTVLSWGQLIVGVILLTAFTGLVFLEVRTSVLAANLIMIIFYLIFAHYKLTLQFVSLHKRSRMMDLEQLNTEDLPSYTVLVPLYKEASAVKGLTEHLLKIDYPLEKLQIMLLVEEDDTDTAEAIKELDLSAPFEIFNIPVSMPKTKPKACNVALPHAKGEYLVIYDAEDRPEIDQLKKAVHLFSQSDKEVICVQAHLNFYNKSRNILTRLFTAEYSTWFDYCLLGLFRLQAPIPLGGTSNHFKLSSLRELKGWDPYNVTEDCDLGIRLYIAGYRTRLLDSTTWEEATFQIAPWIRQRSRWIKGYMQTYLVHLRQHSILMKKMGIGKTIHFHFLFGATCFCLLLNPLYWLMALLWFTVHPAFISEFFPIWIMLPALISFLAGNAAFVLSAMLGCLHRRYFDLIPYTLLMPLYWVLMSIAAWKGILQLITRPFYWEKTPHEGTARLEETL